MAAVMAAVMIAVMAAVRIAVITAVTTAVIAAVIAAVITAAITATTTAVPGGCDSSRLVLSVPNWLAEAATAADLKGGSGGGESPLRKKA